jgi:hypothetical protein
MKRSDRFVRVCRIATAAAFSLAFGAAEAAATLQILNADGPGEGFNDPTVVAPVGGNPGVTLGQQRQIAFQYAADLWGAQLNSPVPITVLANFDPLSCTATSAVLGAAGAVTIWSDFPGAGKPGTWYGAALANKLAGVDLLSPSDDPTFFPEIVARFNSRLGQPGCLTGTGFYLGLDGNAGNQLDLVAVLLHEFGHGLGFQTFTRGGIQILNQPSIWDYYLEDQASRMTWAQMTQEQRQVSAITPRNLAWTGAKVRGRAAKVLDRGVPELSVVASGGGEKSYLVGTAQFGPSLVAQPVIAQLAVVNTQPDSPGNGCTPFDAANQAAVFERVAIIDRGVCAFTVKVKNAQNAGARAVIIVDNVAGSPPPDLGGADPTITIPSVRVTQADGAQLKSQVAAAGHPFHSPWAYLCVDMGRLTGAARGNKVLLYTPDPFASGSSVSHWDTSATPNLLMEPFINAGLSQSVRAPKDLTLELLLDIGW